MTFSKSGTTITWTNPYLYYKWNGEDSSKANLKLTLVTSSGVTKYSTIVRAEFTATYLTSADLSHGSFTFTDCSLNTSDITGIEFRLQYPDGTGEYHLIQIVNAKV
jgi:uncharacterized protein YjbI with pentapeptide repeats